MEKRYRVTLTEEERQELQSMVSAGKAAARKLVRARILLLADRMVALGYVESVCHEAVRQTQKNELKPWLKKGWCLPEGPSAEFVAAMEPRQN
jgi:hypothetical protein